MRKYITLRNNTISMLIRQCSFVRIVIKAKEKPIKRSYIFSHGLVARNMPNESLDVSSLAKPLCKV